MPKCCPTVWLRATVGNMTRKARIPAKTKRGDRFTVEQVLAIRLQSQRGHTQAEIARAYRCSEMSIYRLLAGRTYKRVRSDVDAPELPETPRTQQGPSPAAHAVVSSLLSSRRPAPKPTAVDTAEATTPTKTAPPPAAPAPPPPPAAPAPPPRHHRHQQRRRGPGIPTRPSHPIRELHGRK